MFDAAISAALPEKIVSRHLPAPPKGRTIVVGAGKASAGMTRAVEDHWPGPIAGLVITRYGHAVPCRRIEIVEAAHPVPDAAGHAAAQRILELAKGAGPDDLVLCLISGGGSALLALPAPGLTLEDGSVEKLGVPAVRGSRSAAPASTANSVPASASCSRPSIPPQS